MSNICKPENLLGPVRDVVLSVLKQGKAKPCVIVLDATTATTNWMPRIVDDVSGVPGQPATISTFQSLDEFESSRCPPVGVVEWVRRGLADHPDDVVVVSVNDEGVYISNFEMTV